MGRVIVAFAFSVPLGVALGVLGATRSHGNIRPCRLLREHLGLARRGGLLLAVSTATVVALASARVDYQRAALALTAAVIAVLVGVVVWMFLVETDDDGAGADDEPEWWPSFERELEEWISRTRVPSGSAR